MPWSGRMLAMFTSGCVCRSGMVVPATNELCYTRTARDRLAKNAEARRPVRRSASIAEISSSKSHFAAREYHLERNMETSVILYG